MYHTRIQQCPEHRSGDHRHCRGLSIEVEEQTRPLVESRGAPAMREEAVEEADDGSGLVELRQVLLAEYIRAEYLTAVLDEQIGCGAAQERGVHGQAELPISFLDQFLLLRCRHGLYSLWSLQSSRGSPALRRARSEGEVKPP